MPGQLSARSLALEPDHLIDIGQRVWQLSRQGIDVVHLGVGDPQYESPPNAVEAAITALRDGKTHYSDSHGILMLREAAADYLNRTRPNLSAVATDVLVGPGIKPLIFTTMMLLLGPGDEAIYPNPGFPSFGQCITYSGAKGVPCPLREEREFRMDPADVEQLITPKTKLLVVNSPHNPTGAVLSEEDIQGLAALAIKHDLYVLSDEIYSMNVFPGARFHSIASLPNMRERTIVLDGTIKSLAMTGWRCGFILAPPHLVEPYDTLHMNIWSCMPVFLQEGIAAALAPSNQARIDEMNAEYVHRCNLVVDAVASMPLVQHVVRPKGAFYVFFRLADAWKTRTKEVCSHILEDHHVAVAPGSAFGTFGEGYVRISVCGGSIERLEEGLSRLRAGLTALSRVE